MGKDCIIVFFEGVREGKGKNTRLVLLTGKEKKGKKQGKGVVQPFRRK